MFDGTLTWVLFRVGFVAGQGVAPFLPTGINLIAIAANDPGKVKEES